MDKLGMKKLDFNVDTKIPADSLFGFFVNNMHRFVHLFPRNIKSVQIQGGGNVRTGCIMYWKYDLGITGSPMTVKTKVQEIDDVNKSITMLVLEGDIMKMYKNFKTTIKFNENIMEDSDNNSSMKWTFEYEKISENYPDPDDYADFAMKISKGMDSHLRAGLN